MRRMSCAPAALNEALHDVLGPVERGDVENEALEIVVVVLAVEIMMRGARGEIGFGTRAKTKQDSRIDVRALRFDDLHRARHRGLDLADDAARGRASLMRSVLLSTIRSAHRSWSS